MLVWKAFDFFIRTFTMMGELLWYYCSPVCGLPTQWVWDLSFSCMHLTYHLIAASPLSLDMMYIFGGFLYPPVDGCPTASCDFGFLVEEDEHTFFYSDILNPWAKFRSLTAFIAVFLFTCVFFLLLLIVNSLKEGRNRVIHFCVTCVLWVEFCHPLPPLFILFMEFSRQEYWSGLPFSSPVNQTGLEWANLIQMTIISTTVGKNPLKESLHS